MEQQSSFVTEALLPGSFFPGLPTAFIVFRIRKSSQLMGHPGVARTYTGQTVIDDRFGNIHIMLDQQFL